MPRGLSPALNDVVLGTTRKPRFQLLVYDLRSTENDATPILINDVVQGNALPAIVGPRDFTADVSTGSIEEMAGDYNTNGVAASKLRFFVRDPTLDLDPVFGANGRWLRQGNVVRLIEGDDQVTEADWLTTFTGILVGQPGLIEGRVAGDTVIDVQAVSRETTHLQRSLTSDAFDEGVSYFDMAEAILVNDMKLDPTEFNLPNFGSQITGVETTQFVEESPLVMLAQLALLEGLVPRFDGSGVMGFTDGAIEKAAARVYLDADGLVIDIARPSVQLSAVNEVTVRGLNPNLEKIVSPRQVLADVSVTVGYFTPTKNLTVFFSEDRTQQVEGSRIRVRSSVNGLLPIGGESYTENTDVVGTALSGKVKVSSGYYPALLVISGGVMIASAVLPDISVPGITGGPTIPVGKIAYSIVLFAVTTIMQSMGTGVYEINAHPIEFVYPEVKAIARKKGVRSEDRKKLAVSNHLIQTEADCQTVADRMLRRAQKGQNARAIRMVWDPLLEPDDVFQYEDRRYMIQTVARAFGRETDGTARLGCFEVTAGVIP